MDYGYKKGAEVIFNITNLTTPLVFGLGTKKEIKQLKSKDNCQQYCDGHERVSNIQYYFNNDTNITLTIPSKSILTPFSISCNRIFSFKIQLNIINGKNHLDYRYQTLCIFILVFMIIFFVMAVVLAIISIIRMHDCKGLLFLLLPLSVLLIGLQSLIYYFFIYNHKNDEFIDYNSKYYAAEYYVNIINNFVIAFYYMMVLSLYTSNFFSHFLIIILLFINVFTIIPLFYLESLIAYIFQAIIYLHYFLFCFLIPLPLSTTRFACLLSAFSGFFTYFLFPYYFIDNIQQIQNCQMLTIIEYIKIVVQFVIVVLIFFDYVQPRGVLNKFQIENSYEIMCKVEDEEP